MSNENNNSNENNEAHKQNAVSRAGWPHKFALSLFVLLGALPLCYFAGVEYGIAEQLSVAGELYPGENYVDADSSKTLDDDSSHKQDSSDNVSDNVSDSDSSDDSNSLAERDPLDRSLRNLSFGVGEELHFDINYGFINAGTAIMSVLDIVEWEERPCYYIQTLAHSNSFFSSIFPVNDTVETIVDAVGLCSWHFEKKLREGSYNSDRIYSFDQINGKAYYGANDSIDVPRFVQDVLSSFYFVRTLDLKVGETVTVDNFSRDTVAPLEVKVLRKETVETDAGEFDCIVVEPLLQAAGVFRHEGKLTVWLTDDRLKMPVLMKSKVIVGAISATLTDYRLGEIEEF